MELLDTDEENSDEPAEAEVRLFQYSSTIHTLNRQFICCYLVQQPCNKSDRYEYFFEAGVNGDFELFALYRNVFSNILSSQN